MNKTLNIDQRNAVLKSMAKLISQERERLFYQQMKQMSKFLQGMTRQCMID